MKENHKTLYDDTALFFKEMESMKKGKGLPRKILLQYGRLL